jgi:hypothetical protein
MRVESETTHLSTEASAGGAASVAFVLALRLPRLFLELAPAR